MRRRLMVMGAAGALVLGVAPEAKAQRSGFAIDRFDPAERGSQFFVVDTLDFRGSGRPAIGAVFDYSYKPLVVYNADKSERAALVRHQMFTHVGASAILFERLRLAANLPIAVYQDGEATNILDSSTGAIDTYRAAGNAALGDVRLAADLRIAGQYGDAFVLAAGVRGYLPTGSRSEFTSDRTFRVAPQIMAAGDVGVFTYAARLGVSVRPLDDRYAGTSLGSELTGSAGAGLKALDGRLVIGPEFYASTIFTDKASFFKTRGTPADWLFGLHYDVGEVRLGAGAGGGVTRGLGAPQLRVVASLEWIMPAEKSDRDKDTVPDDQDACPDAAGVPSGDPQRNGCPEPPPPPPPDTDGDGVLDREDACPRDGGPHTNDPTTNGCPDRDSDGVVDSADACPDTAGVRDSDPKKNGCPPDRDDDGVADSIDACPDVAGVHDADPRKNGCPGDRDGDGVPDNDDACPDAPGPKQPDPKKNGCPLVQLSDKAIEINEQVNFKVDSAEILEGSTKLLEAIKKVLDEHPELVKVRVEGHTDNVGRADYNKKLSQKRAEAVVKWLTTHGVDAKRFKAQGYGQEQPLDSNETEQGRANNRRVAFVIVERDSAKAPAK